MYLHEDRELFQEVIANTAVWMNLAVAKGFHVLNRFSEDIDITFTEHLGEARRKKLKYNVMKQVSEELGMPISNWSRALRELLIRSAVKKHML